MKKTFGHFLFLLYTLAFVVCNTGYSNVGYYFSNHNSSSLLKVDYNVIDELSDCHVIVDSQIENQKQLYAEINDIGEEEGDENLFSSQQKFNFSAFLNPFFNAQLLEHLSFKLQSKILSVKANSFISSFKLYQRFQVYRI
tara:strand:- start:20369 stop:20788 length:420 start_codon:yes stop_codon:yes gene_type:complete